MTYTIMKKLLFCLLGILPMALVQAETLEHIAANPHEVRIGLGDPVVHLFKDNGILLADGSVIPHTNDKAYTVAHIFAEYNYRFGKRCSVGFQFDFLPVFGSDYAHLPEDAPGIKTQLLWDQYHFTFMPTFKCYYLNKEMVSLYSGVGVGLSYAKYKSSITWEWVEGIWNPAKRPVREVFGAALDITAIGVSVGKNHLFGNFELGALLDFETGVRNRVIPSRFISASIGYRF